MRRSDTLALAGAILMSFQGVLFATGPVFRSFYAPDITAWKLPVWVAGWALITYGPILTAALFWRWADRFSHSWLLHILMIPCLYALLLAGGRSMGSTVRDSDFDSTLGAPVVPAFLSALVVIAIYFSALAAKQISRWQSRLNGS